MSLRSQSPSPNSAPSPARPALRASLRAAAVALALAAPIGLAPAFLAPVAHAQVNTGTLSGLVLDPSGAAVAGATVTLKSPETGYTRAIQSASDGAYTLPNLPIGNYDLTVAAAGFQGLEERVMIEVGERSRVDLHLTVGSTGQTVEVQAGANLSLDDASIGTVVTNETIAETPLFLRNWDDLLRTVPGIQINRYTNQSGATNAGRTGDFNVNGVHSLQNNFILDGIDNNTFSENVQELSTESAHPSVDVISEFNVITNPYSAEYGRAPGAVISVNTKNGTNQFHGTAYEYVRNQFFDAFDYFSKQSLVKKAEDNQNQFGGSIGGPVLHDKLFFFFNFEDTRIKQGVSRISTVPLDNERKGDFSPAAAAANNTTYPTLIDPASCATPNTPASGGCSTFENNQIPSNRFDPTMVQLFALFPEPNYHPSTSYFPETNNYSRTGGLSDINASYDARVDWTPSQADTIFGRFNYFNRTRDIPGYFGGLEDGSSTSAWGDQVLKGASVVLGYTRILNPRLVNDFRFGWVRDYSKAVQQPYSLTQYAGNFVPGIPINPAIGGGIPLTSFSNGAFEGSPDYLPKQQVPMLYQYNDTLSWSKGNHNLKFGVTLYAPMRNIFQDEPGTRGDLTFTGAFTGYGKPLSGPGASYADGLLGDTQSDQLTNVFFVDQRLWMASGFVEDDWKVTPRFTLNAGLRYDFATPAMEGANRLANFDPTANAGAGGLTFAKSGSVGDRSLVDPTTTNFAPRIGATYAITPGTVLRAGYGIYYTVLERFGSEDQLALNPPNLVNKVLSSNVTPVIQPSVGFPTGYLTADLSNLKPYHIRAVNPDLSTPRVQQYSFGVQQQIGPAWIGEVDYVGTHSDNLDILRNYNQYEISAGQVVYQTGTTTPVLPYPNFGEIEYMDSIGHSNYDGLQASLKRQMRKGFSLSAAYTFSHALDNAPEEEETNSGDAPDGRNYGAWYGNADFDVRHRISVNYVYDLPFGRGKTMLHSGPLSWVLGNWRTSGVYTYYSGHPFQAAWSSNGSYLDAYGFTTATPNQVAAVHYPHKQTCWFYDAANNNCSAYAGSGATPFVNPGEGVIGNVGRNTLLGPPTQLFDMDLIKQFPINERVNFEFRWEIFNLFNHTIFGQPSGNVSSGSVGSITSLSADPRVMQFAGRISF